MRASIVCLRVAALVAGLAIVLMASVADAAGAVHDNFDATGQAFTCSTSAGVVAYTITSGEAYDVYHEGFTPSGRWNVTGTTTAHHIVAADQDGNIVRIVGANWFGGAGDATQAVFTATGKFQILALDGSVVGSVNETTHMNTRNGQFFDFNFGNCATPE
jgi:hypothetical protein